MFKDIFELINYLIKRTQEDIENELVETKEKFSAVTSYALDAIIILDDEGRVIFWNNTAEYIFGYNAAEIIGRNFADFIYENTEHDDEVMLKRFKDRTVDFLFKRKDGNIMEAEVSFTKLRLEEKNHTIFIIRDITERNAEAREMARMTSLLKATLEATSNGILVLEAKTRKIKNYNNNFLKMFNIYEEKISDKDGDSLIEEMLKQLSNEDKIKLDRIKDIFHSSIELPEDQEKLLSLKNGRHLAIHSQFQNIDDEVVGIVWSFKDITKQVKYQHALKSFNESLESRVKQRTHELQEKNQLLIRSEKRYRAIVQNQIEIIVRLGRDYYLNYVNHSFSDLMRKKVDEVVGSYFTDSIKTDDIKIFENAIKKIDYKNKLVHIEIRHKINDEIYWIHWNIIGIFDEKEKLIEYQAVGRDITERKKMESELYHLATTDMMTNLLNRTTGLKILDEKIMEVQKNNLPLSIIFIDVNKLKMVNDNYGHDEGDFLITKSVEFFRDSVRKHDYVCRLGGDEFLIILPECKTDMAEFIWNRIKGKMEDFNSQNIKPYRISISHGVMEYNPDEPVSMDELIKLADEKMYEEKKTMR